MKRFIYLIAEGVNDVLIISKVLQCGFGLAVIKQLENLPPHAQSWLNRFAWPIRGDITRRSVPTPEFLQNDTLFVAISNAQGITNMQQRLKADFEAFFRVDNWFPSTLGIIIDLDDESAEQRFSAFAQLIKTVDFPTPTRIDSVARSDTQTAGVFAFPGKGLPGTLEDVLIPLADTRFPQLHAHAASFVQTWQQQDSQHPSPDHHELRKPKGSLKATLSAMVSLLKPGAGLLASIRDQKWVPDDITNCPALQPLTDFLTALLIETPPRN
jgi:hypothetical protein